MSGIFLEVGEQLEAIKEEEDGGGDGYNDIDHTRCHYNGA